MTRPTCSRPNCTRIVMNRHLCKYHYPVAYPASVRGDVDATRARDHLKALRNAGFTKSMLDDHGITDGMVRRIEGGKQKIRRLTEIRLLAIPLPAVWLPTGATTDATGTRRRLQALGAIGYTQEDIADHLGLIQRRIAAISSAKRVTAATARRISDLFNELQLTTGPSDIARSRAHIRGWPPPFAWDEDTIDDPSAEPFTGASARVSTSERIAELDDLGIRDVHQIAERLGVQPQSVERQIHRYGIAS